MHDDRATAAANRRKRKRLEFRKAIRGVVKLGGELVFIELDLSKDSRGRFVPLVTIETCECASITSESLTQRPVPQ